MEQAPNSAVDASPAARDQTGLVKTLAAGLASQSFVAALATAAAYSASQLPARRFLLPFVLLAWCGTLLGTGLFLASRERARPQRFALIMGFTFFVYLEACTLVVIFALVWLGFETQNEAVTATLPFWVNAAALLSLILYLMARRRMKQQEARAAKVIENDRS